MKDYKERKKFKSRGVLLLKGFDKHAKIMNRRCKGKESGSYTEKGDAERLAEYMLRDTEQYSDRREELIAWGALGIPEVRRIEDVMDGFGNTWGSYPRGGKFGRYVYHEVYSFRTEDELLLEGNYYAIDRLARELAWRGYYEQGYQVLYAVHRIRLNDAPKFETADRYIPLEKIYAEENLHIHFMINAVNYETLNKFRATSEDQAKREALFNELVSKEAHKYFGCRTQEEFEILQGLSDAQYALYGNYLNRIHAAGKVIAQKMPYSCS